MDKKNINIGYLIQPFNRWCEVNKKKVCRESADEFCVIVGLKQVLTKFNYFEYFVVDEKKYLLSKLKYGKSNSN